MSREAFETAAYAHYLVRHAAGQTQDAGNPPCTPDELFWRQPDDSYGVLMFNAAWWGWKEAEKHAQANGAYRRTATD